MLDVHVSMWREERQRSSERANADTKRQVAERGLRKKARGRERGNRAEKEKQPVRIGSSARAAQNI